MEYTIIIRKAPDEFYIADCLLIPEANAQGKTHEEIELCLEYRRQHDEEISDEVEA